MSRPPLVFIPDPLTLALDRILPSRKTPEGLHTFSQPRASSIAASTRATFPQWTFSLMSMSDGYPVGPGTPALYCLRSRKRQFNRDTCEDPFDMCARSESCRPLS